MSEYPTIDNLIKETGEFVSENKKPLIKNGVAFGIGTIIVTGGGLWGFWIPGVLGVTAYQGVKSYRRKRKDYRAYRRLQKTGTYEPL